MSSKKIDFIKELEEIIESRSDANEDSSYTKQLLSRGIPYIAQKVGEEAVELSIAAVQENRTQTIEEAADLLYHVLVLLNANELELGDVVDELQRRHQ
ncbi:MAG: phosphoribosyl-ATP diphosphatase [Pseudomonadota bacterium]|nr:phosphoribosyl-ATP diphosphatase [Pseudomonadota bacterium]